MVAIALDKIAVFYGAQKKWDEARDAAARANAIRAYLLADGLSGEATQRIEDGKMTEALPIYQRALKVLDFPDPAGDAPLSKAIDEQRTGLADMEKELEKLARKPATPPPPQKTKK
jgi:hypothetical protein